MLECHPIFEVIRKTYDKKISNLTWENLRRHHLEPHSDHVISRAIHSRSALIKTSSNDICYPRRLWRVRSRAKPYFPMVHSSSGEKSTAQDKRSSNFASPVVRFMLSPPNSGIDAHSFILRICHYLVLLLRRVLIDTATS
jgi:hypothetical protein